MTSSDDVGKLFIGGLGWDTSKEVLQEYFSQFGEITDCVVMKNSETGQSRGFGFVTFKDPNCVFAVLQAKPHQVNGRNVDAKQCTPRGSQRGGRRGGGNQGKLFIGGLPPTVTETDINQAFSRFGVVNNINIMYDQETKKCRGFGFLSFESDESIDQACDQRYVSINGKQIECKRAEPRNSNGAGGGNNMNYMNNSYGRQNNAYRGGGNGGGGGGYQGGWEMPTQQYPPQEQMYNNYQSYAAPSAGGASYTSPYAVQATDYSSTYAGYGNSGYGGNDASTAGYADPSMAGQYQVAFPPQQQSSDKAGTAMAPSYGGAGFGNQTSVGRGQAYHPYRR